MAELFRVGITRDLLNRDGELSVGDIGLAGLEDAPNVAWEFLPRDGPALAPAHVRGYDALLCVGRRFTRETLEGADRLAIVARYGVGYDSVDVAACTGAGVMVTITPDAVQRPVATVAIGFMLALSLKLMWKDRITREGRWAERYDDIGVGLRGRVLGMVGLGNIGREVVRLASPFDMNVIAADPYADPEMAAGLGVKLVELDDLMRAADFVCISCRLNDETRALIDARRLGLMKPTAHLMNVARGPIIDQGALTEVLRKRRISGAALDVFEEEPIDPGDPLLELDNVLLTPHAACMTDECFLAIGTSAISSILEVAAGRAPAHVVNSEALDHPRLRDRLRAYAARAATA